MTAPAVERGTVRRLVGFDCVAPGRVAPVYARAVHVQGADGVGYTFDVVENGPTLEVPTFAAIVFRAALVELQTRVPMGSGEKP